VLVDSAQFNFYRPTRPLPATGSSIMPQKRRTRMYLAAASAQDSAGVISNASSLLMRAADAAMD